MEQGGFGFSLSIKSYRLINYMMNRSSQFDLTCLLLRGKGTCPFVSTVREKDWDLTTFGNKVWYTEVPIVWQKYKVLT